MGNNIIAGPFYNGVFMKILFHDVHLDLGNHLDFGCWKQLLLNEGSAL